jgi:uncharacterized membrane protein
MTAYFKVLLTLHVLGAIAGFGATFSFPFIGAMAQKPGAPVPWFLKLNHLIESKWVIPIAATVQPLTGALLILQSKGTYNPFNHRGRWLLAGIILYIIAFFYSLFVQDRNALKALKMAEAQEFGPEFGGLMKKLGKGGQLLTLLLVAIIILMVVKPGSGVIHP